MSDVLNRFDIHDLSSLVLKMVTLSAHTISLARLFQLFITLCEKELRRTVLFARGFTILYGFLLVSCGTNVLFSILYKIIMSKRCRRYSNVGWVPRVAFHMANPLILALVLYFFSEHFLWCACSSLWLG